MKTFDMNIKMVVSSNVRVEAESFEAALEQRERLIRDMQASLQDWKDGLTDDTRTLYGAWLTTLSIDADNPVVFAREIISKPGAAVESSVIYLSDEARSKLNLPPRIKNDTIRPNDSYFFSCCVMPGCLG